LRTAHAAALNRARPDFESPSDDGTTVVHEILPKGMKRAPNVSAGPCCCSTAASLAVKSRLPRLFVSRCPCLSIGSSERPTYLLTFLSALRTSFRKTLDKNRRLQIRWQARVCVEVLGYLSDRSAASWLASPQWRVIEIGSGTAASTRELMPLLERRTQAGPLVAFTPSRTTSYTEFRSTVRLSLP
jgi:hypothetical protein